MNNKYTSSWIILLALCFGYIPQAQAQTSLYGDFPYYQAFRSDTIPAEVEKVTAPPGATNGNAADFTTDGVQLTPALGQRFGGIFIKNRQFRANQGIRVEFEYVMYGGGNDGGDGMSVFLFDASVATPTIGAPGCGLGYTYNRANDIYYTSRATGLDGAYLGVGLDGFGNFKSRRWQGNSRVNGLTGVSGPSHVTLRGARGGKTQTSQFLSVDGMGAGYTGYPVLATQSTLTNLGRELNPADGTYNSVTTYQGNFDLRAALSDYRKAIVELYPLSPTGSGFSVTVKIQHGQEMTTVIDDYQYGTTLDYYENAHNSIGDFNNNHSNTTLLSVRTTLSAIVPDSLRIGFAASTGDNTNIHLLRDLKITLPGSAEANDDYGSTPQAIPVVIDVLDNDIGYTGAISRDQVGSKGYLDPFAFRFCDQQGNRLGTLESGETYYTTGQGTWRFDFTTAKLTFTPAGTFTGVATVQYRIRAGLNNESPYNDQAYRSLPATVTVDVIPQNAVISNRMVTPIIVW